MREIKIEGNEVVFREFRGGTAGTNYFYVAPMGELIHRLSFHGHPERR